MDKITKKEVVDDTYDGYFYEDEDESIYNQRRREYLLDDEEISPEEEGFMMGWKKLEET